MYSYTYNDGVTETTVTANNIIDFVDLCSDVFSVDIICDLIDDNEEVWQVIADYADVDYID